jgi:hypothetical protein
MEKEFVPYEQALELKELGFNEPCLGYYVGKDKEVYMSNETLSAPFQFRLESKTTFVVPTFSQAFRWFREKYDLYSQTPSTCVEENDRIFYNNPIYDELDNIVFDSMEQYTTYEEAEIACLKKLIEIVKQK